MSQLLSRSYYISDKAYNSLIGLGQRHKYILYGTSRAKGMSEFLIDLADKELEDTRPPFVRQRHEEEIKWNRAPTWLHSRQRRARLLTLTDHAIECYFKVAFEVGIIRVDPPYTIGGPARDNPIPSVAFVLEAIGLKWIQPINEDYPIGNK